MASEKILPTKNNMINVMEEPLFETFCNDRDLAKRTIELHGNNIQKYCDFLNMSLEDILEEAEDEEEQHIRYRKRNIAKYLKDFKKHIEGYAPSTQNQIMISVKAFYNHYDITLPKSKAGKKSRKAKTTKNLVSIESLPKMEEIKDFLEYCNKGYKFVVILGVSSGMSRAEISSLTFKHLYDAFSFETYPDNIPEMVKKLKAKNDFIPTWCVQRVKTGHQYYTFSSPESVEYLIQYLEKLYYKFPDFKPKPEDHLIRGLRSNKHAIPTNIGTYLYNINHEHGFRIHNGRYVCLPHGFRRFFASTLERNKVPHLTTRLLMGHLFDNTTGAYFKIDPKTAKEDYLEVVNELSINTVEVKKLGSMEYNELQAQLERYKQQFAIRENELKEEMKIITKLLEDKDFPVDLKNLNR